MANWIFAYGSNMDIEHLLCWFNNHEVDGENPYKDVGIIAACRSKIAGYRRVWNHKNKHHVGVLNLEPDPEGETHGVAFLLTDSGLKAVDAKEGFKPEKPEDSSYLREPIWMELCIEPAMSVNGFMYVSRCPQDAPVTTTFIYQRFVVNGAKFFNLPAAEIEAIKAADAIGVIVHVFPPKEPLLVGSDAPNPEDLDKADDPDSELDTLAQVLEKITVPEYRRVGDAFLTNLRKSYNLILLPYNFITKTKISEITASVASREYDKAYNHLIKTGEYIDDDIKEQRLKKQLEECFQNEDTIKQVAESTHEDLLRQINTDSDIAEYVHALLSTSISFTWTSFEIFGRDLWIEAVNKDPVDFAQKCASDKTLTISQLAQMKFQLDAQMGLLLADKFDFTNLKNIISSFDSILEKRFRGILQSYEKKEFLDLFVTEKLRHLIQHKAGVVDKKFIAEIGIDNTTIPLTEGTRIRLNYAVAVSGIKSAALLGSRILSLLHGITSTK